MVSSLRRRSWLLWGLLMGALDAAAREPDRPEPVREAGWMREMARHQTLLTNRKARVCFIGDSLTAFWLETGRRAWDARFAALQSLALGIAGDRTEHVLYRVAHLDFHRADPRVFVLWMGTNNLGQAEPDSPERVVGAIVEAARRLRAKQPRATVLIVELTPNGGDPGSPLNVRVRETNTRLRAAVLPPGCLVVPIHGAMVGSDGQWRPGLTLDGTHLSPKGYAALADPLATAVETVLRDTDKRR